MPWSKFASMELSDDEKLDFCAPCPVNRPDYPYGLRISLTQSELDKLGRDTDLSIGDLVDLRALCEVTSISKDAGPNGENCRVELQITHLAVENETTEDIDDDDDD